MERYACKEKMHCGEGSYGAVYKAVDVHTGQTVAVKRIKLQICDHGIDSYTLREVTILRSLNHTGIVKLLDTVIGSRRCYLIFEFVARNLFQYIHATGKDEFLGHETIRDISRQLINGLAYCHSMGVMHRDLKPHNVLVTSEGCVKLADFGMSRFVTPSIHSLSADVVTHLYRPPEILLGLKRYCCKVDIWSAACIIAELCSKRVLFYPICFLAQLRKRSLDEYPSPQYTPPPTPAISNLFSIFKILGTPTEEVWPELTSMPYFAEWFPSFPGKNLNNVIANLPEYACDFLEHMLVYDPTVRLSALEALQHPFLA